MPIYLAGNRLPITGFSTYGHLQLVSGGEEIEVQRPDSVGGTWVFEKRSHDGTTNGVPNTPGFGELGYYAATAIDIGDRSDSEMWSLLEEIHGAFSGQSSITYLLVTQNSNSYINTLLYMVGIDISLYLDGASPEPIPLGTYDEFGFEDFTPFVGLPGVGLNVLRDSDVVINFDLTLFDSDDTLNTGYGADRVFGRDGNDEIFTSSGSDTLDGGLGNDFLDGGEGDDTVTAGRGNDTLIGGDGADWLSAAGGNDLIIFDAEDTAVLGGGGWDTAYAEGGAAVTLDLAASSIETVVSWTSDSLLRGDTFANVGRNHRAAGGEGDDLFLVATGGGGNPPILWGDFGADTFHFAAGQDDPVGIMVVTVQNLTLENFDTFNRNMINVGQGFDWNQIDAIIVNPESTDRVMINGEVQGVAERHFSVENNFQMEDGEWDTEEIAALSFLMADNSERIADFFDVSFLGQGSHSVFAGGAFWNPMEFFQFEDPIGEAAWRDTNGPRWWDGVLSTDNAIAGSPDYRFDGVPIRNHFDLDRYIAYPDGYGGAPTGPVINDIQVGVSSLDSIGTFSSAEALGPWFIAGGRFEGNNLIPDDPWTVIL